MICHTLTNIICNNYCRTITCTCGQEFYKEDGNYKIGHDPMCGELYDMPTQTSLIPCVINPIVDYTKANSYCTK